MRDVIVPLGDDKYLDRCVWKTGQYPAIMQNTGNEGFELGYD
jgi:hypothetical protein